MEDGLKFIPGLELDMDEGIYSDRYGPVIVPADNYSIHPAESRG